MALICMFSVPGQPVPKARPRVVRGGTYTPPRTAEAEQRIAQYLKVAYPHLKPATGRLKVALTFHVKGVGGDIDNYAKLVLDALNGRAWVDDKQIDGLVVSVWRKRADPGLMVSVMGVPEGGSDE